MHPEFFGRWTPVGGLAQTGDPAGCAADFMLTQEAVFLPLIESRGATRWGYRPGIEKVAGSDFGSDPLQRP